MSINLLLLIECIIAVKCEIHFCMYNKMSELLKLSNNQTLMDKKYMCKSKNIQQST